MNHVNDQCTQQHNSDVEALMRYACTFLGQHKMNPASSRL